MEDLENDWKINCVLLRSFLGEIVFDCLQILVACCAY